LRSVVALLVLVASVAMGACYFAFTKLRDTRPEPTAAATLSLPAPLSGSVPLPAPASPPSAASSDIERAQNPARPLRAAPGTTVKKSLTVANVVGTAPTLPPPKPDNPRSFGFLTIDTSPWSLVSVAGRALGQTPLMNVKLPAGSQVLSLRNPEQGIETSYAVTIESGKTTVRRLGIE
jgi:hypothetical protein